MANSPHDIQLHLDSDSSDSEERGIVLQDSPSSSHDQSLPFSLTGELKNLARSLANWSADHDSPKSGIYSIISRMADLSDECWRLGSKGRQDLRQLNIELLEELFKYRMLADEQDDARHYMAIDFDDTMSRSFFPQGDVQGIARPSFIRPMEAFFKGVSVSGRAQVEIFSHKTTFENMQTDRQTQDGESYLQFLLKHPEFDVYTSDDLLYTDVPEQQSGYSSRDIALPLVRRFYDISGRFLPNYSADNMARIRESVNSIRSLENDEEIQNSVKALVAHIKSLPETRRRPATVDEAETIDQLITLCHQHYYTKTEHTTDRSLLKADMLNHRLQWRDASSFSTATLVDDAFDNVGAFVLSALQHNKTPFAFQVVKGHPAFTLEEHVVFETVQTDILYGLYVAFTEKNRSNYDQYLLQLTYFYQLMNDNNWESTQRTDGQTDFIAALRYTYQVDPARIRGYLNDIPERVSPREDTGRPTRGSFFSRHKDKFVTAVVIALLALAFAPLAAIMGLILIKTLPLVAAILIPVAIFAGIAAIATVARHYKGKPGKEDHPAEENQHNKSKSKSKSSSAGILSELGQASQGMGASLSGFSLGVDPGVHQQLWQTALDVGKSDAGAQHERHRSYR